MIIKFEGVTQREAEAMFLNTVASKGEYPTVKIEVNGKACAAIICNWTRYGEELPELGYEYRRPACTYSFEFETVRVAKSPQEEAAEKSVEDAKKALESATKVLNKLKGK